MIDVVESPQYRRDLKLLRRKRADVEAVEAVRDLIAQDTPEARRELVESHGLHRIRGAYPGASECHAGTRRADLIVVWSMEGRTAVLRRTGTHDRVLRT